MIFLVRHAHAGDKRLWDQPDDLRPLTTSGWQEAHGLLRRLGGFDISGIISSPATRCVQTIEGLSYERSLPVTIDPRLRPDSDVADALDLLFSHDSDDVVLCTHGELIGGVLQALRQAGASIDGGAEWPKGSVWLLDTERGRVTAATYLPPLRVQPYAAGQVR